MALLACPRRLQIKPSFHLSSSRERWSAKGLLTKTENVSGTIVLGWAFSEKAFTIINRIRIT
jgi:hypothetical protein